MVTNNALRLPADFRQDSESEKINSNKSKVGTPYAITLVNKGWRKTRP